jgi:hypothetical protein
MTYEQYKENKERLTESHNVASYELTINFPTDSAFGYKQSTLDNPNFINLLSAERQAFKALRDFNASAPKGFSKRLSKEKRGF